VTNLRMDLFEGRRNLTSLAGLEHFLNLEALILEPGAVVDLSPLSNLTELRILDVSHNQVTDLTPLSGLTSLLVLTLNDNRISDLSPLAGDVDDALLIIRSGRHIEIQSSRDAVHALGLDLALLYLEAGDRLEIVGLARDDAVELEVLTAPVRHLEIGAGDTYDLSGDTPGGQTLGYVVHGSPGEEIEFTAQLDGCSARVLYSLPDGRLHLRGFGEPGDVVPVWLELNPEGLGLVWIILEPGDGPDSSLIVTTTG
jgi:Leucine-rich repeat (LRR) protein